MPLKIFCMKTFENFICSFHIVSGWRVQKFLQTHPADFLTPSNYFEKEEELQIALNGVYDMLGNGEPLWR